MTKRKDKYRTVEQAFNDLRKRMKSVARPEETIPEDFILVDGESFLDDMNLLHSLTFDEICELCTTIDTDKYHSGTEHKKKMTFVRNKINHFLHLYMRILYLNEEYEGDVLDRVFECENYHKKSENIEYMSMIYGREYALKKLKAKSERVAGDKNPGYQHGGKLSAFSKNFKNYEGMTDEEIEAGQKAVAQASSKTKQANPQNENTSIEYYTSRGMSEEEAIIARSERQSTFSLDKCIAEHGEVKGIQVWSDRQIKWMSSLQDKSFVETFDMLRRRTESSMNSISEEDMITVYLFKMTNTNCMKFGVTGSLKDREGTLRGKFNDGSIELVASSTKIPKKVAVAIETVMCQDFLYHTSYMKRVGSYGDILSLETIMMDTISEEKVLRIWKAVLDDYDIEYVVSEFMN